MVSESILQNRGFTTHSLDGIFRSSLTNNSDDHREDRQWHHKHGQNQHERVRRAVAGCVEHQEDEIGDVLGNKDAALPSIEFVVPKDNRQAGDSCCHHDRKIKLDRVASDRDSLGGER